MNYLAFKKFLAAAGLSTRRFGDLCGIGKTTVHRLAQAHHGGLTPKYVREIAPVLMRACRDHLHGAGASADAIHLILSEIFGEEFVPAIVTRAALTPEMLRFFGLARDPFAPPRNASEVFMTEEMRHTLTLLEDAVKFQGFAALLAPVGAGKTIIKNLMVSPRSHAPCPKSGTDLSVPPAVAGGLTREFGTEAQPPDNLDAGTERQAFPHDHGASPYRSSKIQDQRSKIQDQIVLSPKFADTSRITAAGIISYILESFHIKPRRSLVLAQKQLEDHLAKSTTPVALCFDECHRLTDATLTALKNFYELGTGGFQRYLGLVLFGQPQFETRLRLPRFREIAERLAVCRLPPFSAEDTENFLDHSLQHARLFSPGSQVQGPKSEELPATDPGPGAWAPSSLGPKSKVSKATGRSSRVAANDLGTRDVGPGTLFAPDAILAIASRAATPLAIANLAAAGMTEAYKKGEPRVTARFIPDDRGPNTRRFGIR